VGAADGFGLELQDASDHLTITWATGVRTHAANQV
jgi:hypothetical protein